MLIDLLSAILLLAVTLTGGILHWHLPPGSGHTGRGGVGAKLLLGMDRHEWGDIHFWLSLIFVAFMVIHLYQHRKLLRACFA
ncbi:MAG: DUF4405 domain-containing protein [Candidatus Ozemobacteraceae bacterium]